MERPGAPADEGGGVCQRCGTGLPALSTWCPACGANAGAPATAEAGAAGTAGATASGAASAPPLGQPPGEGTSTDTTGEPLLSPTASAVLIGLAIVFILATVGILAGQAMN